MDYKAIFARINAGTVGGMLVFRGAEEYVKDKTLAALKASMVPRQFEDFNYLYLEGDRARVSEIRRAVETLPFMADKRLVVVRDYPMLASSQRGAGLDAAQELAGLEQVAQDFPAYACLVFLQRTQPDAGNAAWKLLVKAAEIVDFDVLAEEEMRSQLAKMAKELSCTIRADAARFMLQYCGDGLEALSHEMEKACAHAGRGGIVTREDIEAVCVQSQESKVFRVIDSIFAGQGADAMTRLRQMTADDEGASAMLALMGPPGAPACGSEIRACCQCTHARIIAGRAILCSGGSQASGSALAGRSNWAVSSPLCANADMSVKQGSMGIQAAVEQLAMNVLMMAGQRNTAAG